MPASLKNDSRQLSCNSDKGWNIAMGRRFDNALYSFEERLSFLIVHAIIKDSKPVLLFKEYRPLLCGSNKCLEEAAFINV